MRHYCDEWIQEWCDGNGWTEPMPVAPNFYWAFPPHAVMPEPIPSEILHVIKAEKGLTPDEKKWLSGAVFCSVCCAIASIFWECPLPLVLAFIFSAVTVAQLDVED